MDPSAAGGSMMGIFAVYAVALVFLVIVPLWRVFSKAGRPGWGSIVPIYNFYLLCKVCGRSGWWVVLCFIPLVNFVIAIILCIDLAKVFGKGAGFAVGLFLLGFIFLPILGYGKAAYQAAGVRTAA